jgi:hypothetical protein
MPTQAEWDAGRPGRQLQMLAAAFEELGLDMQELQAMPPADALWTIARSYEEHGITKAELDGWVAQCDPQTPVAWDPAECIRLKLRIALKQPFSVPKALVLSAAAGFGATLVAIRFLR